MNCWGGASGHIGRSHFIRFLVGGNARQYIWWEGGDGGDSVRRRRRGWSFKSDWWDGVDGGDSVRRCRRGWSFKSDWWESGDGGDSVGRERSVECLERGQHCCQSFPIFTSGHWRDCSLDFIIYHCGEGGQSIDPGKHVVQVWTREVTRENAAAISNVHSRLLLWNKTGCQFIFILGLRRSHRWRAAFVTQVEVAYLQWSFMDEMCAGMKFQ